MKLSYMVATPEVRDMPLAWVGDLAPACATLAEIGYDGVELQVRSPGELDVARVLAAVEAAGQAVAGISTGAMTHDGVHLMSADDSARAEAARRLDLALTIARECHTHVAIGGVRGFAHWAGNRDTGIGWLRDAMCALAERAEALDVRLLLEPLHRGISDVWNTAAETVAFVQSIGSPALRIEADAYHLAKEEPSVADALGVVHSAGLLDHVQLSDTNHRAPGWGELNWSELTALIAAFDYRGWLSIEAEQKPDSSTVAAHSYRFLTGLLSNSV